MIIDKEYPATHSMSTAWYIVDEDGNVGIMDVNDNGPSIVNYRETCLADLIFNAEYNETQNKIDYTEEQILEILSPCEEIHDDIIPLDVVVKIHLSKKDRFFKLLDNPDIKLSFCISEKFGYYMIDASNYISRKAPTFSKILEEDLIKELFQLQQYYIDDINRENDGKITFENDFSSCPFYVYGSGFYNRHCQVRTSIPQHPMKLEQMPECFADEMVKVPLKFSERPTWHKLLQYSPDKIHITIHRPGDKKEVERVINTVTKLSETSIKPGVNLLVSASAVEDAKQVYERLSDKLNADQIILVPQRFSDSPTPRQLASVTNGRPFQSPDCILGCKRPANFCSVSWDKKVNSCSFAGGKVPLDTLDFKGLSESLAKVKFMSCNKTA